MKHSSKTSFDITSGDLITNPAAFGYYKMTAAISRPLPVTFTRGMVIDSGYLLLLHGESAV